MPRCKQLIAVPLVYLLLGSTARGQVVKGAIQGNVIDSTGAVVPGAEVVALDPAISSTGKGISDNTGFFRIPLLAVGTYNVTVTKAGFRQLSMEGVLVDSAATTNVGIMALHVGQVTTTIKVAANSALVEATQSQITNTFSASYISMLPGIGENEGIDNLAILLPGVNNTRDDTFGTSSNGAPFSSNGIRGRNNDQQIDGASNKEYGQGGPTLGLGNIDWVQEYQLTTSNFGVEYSRNSGSVVNIVTKSGTNDWHGSGFITENSWRTATLTNTQKAFEALHQVPRYNDEFSGFSAGGPIVRNKIFVFAGFDDEVIPGSSVDASGALEPTPAGLATLQACLPSSGVLQALSRYGPYAIKAGNPQLVASSLTLKSISIAPNTCADGNDLSATPVQFAGVERTLSSPLIIYDWLGRVDYQATRDRIYARFIYHTLNAVNAGGNGGSGYPANSSVFGLLAGLDWTRTFPTNLVNEARLNYTRGGSQVGGNNYGNTVPVASNLASALTSVNAPSGYASFGFGTGIPTGGYENTYQLQDNLSWTHRRNIIKTGMNLTYTRFADVFFPNYNGTYNFSTIQSYIQDIPTQVSITLGPPELDLREHDNFFYLGDDYKATRNLTLNLGLSYAYFGQPGNLLHRLDEVTETSSSPFFNPDLPLSVRTFPELPSHKRDFGPSLGFAYAPQGGNTVIRGGYRLTYDPAFYNIYQNVANNSPQVLSQGLTGAQAAANPLPAVPFGPDVRSELAGYLTLGVQDPRNFREVTVSPDFGPDHVQGWSLGIQRQLNARAVVESRYVGNHGGGLFQTLDGNPYVAGLAASFPSQVPSGVTPCPAASAVVPSAIGREFCDQGIVLTRANTAVSDYAGWQNELRTNDLWRQLSLRTSFTWSKTTDTTSELYNSGSAGNTLEWPQNPFDIRHGEHALSGIDFPAQWVLSFVELLPFRNDSSRLMGRLLGGWSLSGSYNISSGQPFTAVQHCLNYCTGGNTYDTAYLEPLGYYETARPFLLTPLAPASNVAIYAADLCSYDGVVGCNLDPTQLVSFNAYNTQGTAQTISSGSARFLVNGAYADTVKNTPWGNVGRNTLRDAMTNFGNFQIAKDTKVTERLNVRFDVDFLNVFNHPNYSSVDPFLDDAGYTNENDGFGIPSLTNGGNRTIIFGLKILF